MVFQTIDSGTGTMEKQYLSGIHQDPISTSCVPVSKFSFLRLQVRFCFLSLNSAVIRLDDQLMSLVVLGVSLGEGGWGIQRFRVAILREPPVSMPGKIGWFPLAGLLYHRCLASVLVFLRPYVATF